MGMRPKAATWFEVLTPRDQLTAALRCLAASGAVELQTHSHSESRSALPDLQRGLDEFAELEHNYGLWWPAVEPRSVALTEEPATELDQALNAVRAWQDDARGLVAELIAIRHREADLALLRELIVGGSERLPDLHALANAGPMLDPRLYLLPAAASLRELPADVLTQFILTRRHRFLLVMGEGPQVVELNQKLTALRARPVTLPATLPGEPGAALQAVEQRIGQAEDDRRSLLERLETVNRAHDLAPALGRIRVLEWYAANVPTLPATEHFAWITGWTSDPAGESLETHLGNGKVHYLLRLCEAPADVNPPSVLVNPVWARPFELFAGLLGTPDVADIDPSRIVAIIAPLMFGFMFGDVGHGLVLMLAGFALRNRLPALALLVPGGISSIVFGFLFGSVFGIETLLPALWLHPMQHPVVILGTSLVFGVVVVTTGLLLDAWQCHWRHERRQFWFSRVGLVVTYFALLASFLDARTLWLALAGAAWFIGGAAWLSAEGRGEAIGSAAMEYGEVLLQLLVNTVSFVRVGAFALAHGGLSAAVLGMAAAADSMSGQAIVMLLGNALVIALEGLVVSIQTTRLVLFEFFIRFLRGSGRRFQPLPAPDGDGPALGRNPR